MYIFKISIRYLFGKTKIHAINWISIVSVISISIVSFGLVVALSVFNGYVDIIEDTNREVDPDILIKKTDNSVFSTDLVDLSIIKDSGIIYDYTLESKGLLRSNGYNRMVLLSGIGNSYNNYLCSKLDVSALKSSVNNCVKINIGLAIALDTSVSSAPMDNNISLWIPKREGMINPLAPLSSFVSANVFVDNIYPQVREDFDNMVFLPIDSLRRMLGYKNKEASSIIIFLDSNISNTSNIIQKIRRNISKSFVVLDRNNQHPETAALIKTEKVMTFIIMFFIMLLAIFNVVGCVLMMIIEKKRDNFILMSLGVSLINRMRIFRITGMFISCVGIWSGVLFGVIFSLLQKEYGFISSSNGFMDTALPVDVQVHDIFMILIVSMMISYCMILYASKFLRR